MRIPWDSPSHLGSGLVDLGSDIVSAILITLIGGWHLAREHSDIDAGCKEIMASERLRDGMRGDLLSRAWGGAMVVLPGTESRSQTAIIPDGRTDIPLFLIEIHLSSRDHEPHAIIECKRVSGGDKRLCRKYVLEGMDRFRVGKYGWNHTRGFMVGFVTSESADRAVEGINQYLTGKSRESELLKDCAVGGRVGIPARLSTHQKKAPLEGFVALHHTFLSLV